MFHRAEGFTETSIDAGCAGSASGLTTRSVKGDDASSPGDKIHQALKCSLHCVQIFVDIGVVEFHGGQDGRVRKVVQELRSLVEEC